MNVAAALLTCFLCVASSNAASKDHPIAKVINLLEDLKGKAIEEGKTEEVAFQKFQYWCTTSTDTLKKAIADEKETIDELEDKLAGLKKQKESLEEDIQTLEDQIAKLDATAKKAKEIRKDEADLYTKANDDLAKTIKGVEECIKALSGAESSTESLLLAQKKVKMALSLISVKATREQRQRLQAFADQPKKRPDQLAAGDLDAHVDKYDFKSENVIELLKQLKMKFEDDKLAGTKAETNAVNAYKVAKEARDNARDAAQDSKKKKTKTLGSVEDDIADTNGKLKSENSDLEADSKTLKKTTDLCAEKTSEWETRSETRTLEIKAMDQAMKILSKSTGVRTEAPGNPVPPPSPVFLQISDVSDPKMKAVALLKAAATDNHSRMLERLAVEVSTHLNGPFDQVNNMIEKMIFRLMDEQKQEDEHKHWCDQEIEKTETMEKDKNDKIADLKAEIKVETAAVGTLTEEIAAAEEMISDIVGFMREATEVRETGKKENALAVKDAQLAQKSLTNAIAVLTDFYKSSGEIPKEPWEFIQAPAKLPKDPELWDSGYTSVADPKKQDTGIIAILENVLSDFEKMEAETKSQEAEDQKAFEEDMSANDIEKAGREQEVSSKTAEKKRRADKIASLNSQLKNTESELEKTEQYLSDLQKPCVDTDKGASYEKRKASRTKEIEALRKAQVTLEDAFKAKNFLQIRSHNKLA